MCLMKVIGREEGRRGRKYMCSILTFTHNVLTISRREEKGERDRERGGGGGH